MTFNNDVLTIILPYVNNTKNRLISRQMKLVYDHVYKISQNYLDICLASLKLSSYEISKIEAVLAGIKLDLKKKKIIRTLLDKFPKNAQFINSLKIITMEDREQTILEMAHTFEYAVELECHSDLIDFKFTCKQNPADMERYFSYFYYKVHPEYLQNKNVDFYNIFKTIMSEYNELMMNGVNWYKGYDVFIYALFPDKIDNYELYVSPQNSEFCDRVKNAQIIEEDGCTGTY
jgi:hypothetical protein